MTLHLKVTHTTTYSYSEPVPVSHNEVYLTPREGPWQGCAFHRLTIKPAPAFAGKRLDYFGNQINFFSIHETHRSLVIAATSRVNVGPRPVPSADESPPWESVREALAGDLGPDALAARQFVFESPAIPRLETLADYARESFAPHRPILSVILDLTARIHSDFTFDATATELQTELAEVVRLRRGVCQDFSHLEIGCLRAMGLAARYVSGYLLTQPPPGRPRLVGADASHAWLSVYCGALGWIDVDPTNNRLPSDEHITLAWGREYSDVSPIKGVVIGGGQHTMTVSVDVESLNGQPEPP